MRPANLLLDIDDLVNLKAENNANLALVNMFEAYEKAQDEGDRVYCHPEFWTFIASWGEAFAEIFDDYETARIYLPWINPDNFQSLLNIAFSLSTTSEKADSLESLEQELNDENNGILCCMEMLHKPYVYDILSWYELHCNYIRNYSEWINWHKSEVLTNTEYSNLCIETIVENSPPHLQRKQQKIDYFNTVLIRSFRNEKDALFALAHEIARRNGYIYDEKLSKSEKKRRNTPKSAVFKIKKNNELQYLSLDTENGQFEVCNRKGEHIGVWNLSGIKTANADATGRHNIKIK